ncbi:protein FAM151B isoform X1 [Vespa crabro]|uniref:protein FAM151B isoform X1 n=2 Tax=Vespa crabro TaxID=7445 RepID=UPI001F00336E|nr:protein FAM151B isoform X1 [Vespa crabro]
MDCTTLSKILSFLALIQYAMCGIAPDPKTFFPAIEGNLTKIVWAHAVNSQANLSKALNTDDIMMLEADVVIGNLNNSISNNTNIPIMAHPPDTESDLSLEEFLSSALNSTKGVKLDFKTLDAFERSKPILAEKRKKFTNPLFLNADILPGPVDAKTIPLDSKSFLTGAMEVFPESILSIGWTTRYGSEFNITEGHYTTEQIQKMIETLTENKVSQSITYPVRAGLVANDISAMKTLLNRSSSFGNVTLTIWSSHGDQVDTKKLSELITTIGVDKVYVDVPEDVWNNLDLTSGSSTFNVAMMTAMMLLSFLFVRML